MIPLEGEPNVFHQRSRAPFFTYRSAQNQLPKPCYQLACKWQKEVHIAGLHIAEKPYRAIERCPAMGKRNGSQGENQGSQDVDCTTGHDSAVCHAITAIAARAVPSTHLLIIPSL